MVEMMTGIVLAGGASVRFGGNKALVPWGDRLMVEHILDVLRPIFPELIVAVKNPSDYGFLKRDALVVEDFFEQRHPLTGVFSGVSRAYSDYSFVCACDMPLLRSNFVHALCEAASGYDAAAPVWRGRVEPLCGVYSKKCLAAIRSILEEKETPAADLFRRVRTRFLRGLEVLLADPYGFSFLDIDTPEDYHRIQELIDAASH